MENTYYLINVILKIRVNKSSLLLSYERLTDPKVRKIKNHGDKKGKTQSCTFC
jgi:hypothetical protein